MGRTRILLTAVTALILLAGAVVGIGAVRAGASRQAGPPVVRVPTLPRLGPIETVNQNDVGDPFILPVPAGVRPPTDVPYVSTGPDAYQSAPWSAATAASAVSHGWYVLFGTTDWQANVPTAISTDAVHWTQAPDSLPALPSWAAPSISMTWAPAALRTSAGWVLYYSTEEASSQLECIGQAFSSSPTGPYTDRSSAPMLCQRQVGGSIDPSVVRGPSGDEFLIWKNNGNAVQAADGVWAQQLTADGLGLTGKPHRLLGSDQPWQRGIVEAPAMVPAAAGGYWLFYAGGNWNSAAYDTGLAYCASVTGSCVETSASPFLATGPAVISPGGLDTFTDHHGHLVAAFTALIQVNSTRHPGRHFYNRVVDTAPVLSR